MIYVRRKFQYSCTESEKSFMFVKIVMDRFFRCSSVNGKFPHIYIYICIFICLYDMLVVFRVSRNPNGIC